MAYKPPGSLDEALTVIDSLRAQVKRLQDKVKDADDRVLRALDAASAADDRVRDKIKAHVAERERLEGELRAMKGAHDREHVRAARFRDRLRRVAPKEVEEAEAESREAETA